MALENAYLDQVAAHLHHTYGDRLSEMRLLVPNYHMGNTLLRALARIEKKALWAPRLYTLPAFMEEMHTLHVPSELTLLTRLYEVAHTLKVTEAPFENFIGWGAQLLQDFNTIDHYQVSAEALFKTPTKALDLSSLPAMSKAFWECLAGDHNSVQARWMHLWRFLPTLYHDYQKSLLSDQTAYAGLQRKKVYEALQTHHLDVADTPIVGIGLLGITPIEKKIFTHLQQKCQIAFYLDKIPYHNEKHTQVFAHTSQKEDTASADEPPVISFAKTSLPPPVVQAIGARGVNGQVEALRNMLEELITAEGAEKVAGRIAVVVPDPNFLLPLIHALPTSLGDLRVRLGYPLTKTAAYTLLIALLRYHLAWQEAKGIVTDRLIQAVETLCAHPYLRCSPLDTKRLVEIATTNPKDLSVASSKLEVIGRCMKPIAADRSLFSEVQNCLSYVQKAYQEDSIATWEKVAMQRTLTLWKEIASIWPSKGTPTRLSQPLIKLVHKYGEKQKLPLTQTEGTRGIEIMSLSQTVNLDFPYVFILGMNEGTIPRSTQKASFIPYLLQKTYGWPDQKEEAHRDAYPFYRLLSRTKKICCLYSVGEKNVGERSHYLSQLQYRLGWKIEETVATPALIPTKDHKIVIEKDEQVLRKLSAFLLDDKGNASRRLTPSALNAYLDCPFHFYMRYVAEIKPLDTIEKEITPPLFGKLLHSVMEQLYRPYVGKAVTASTIAQIHQSKEQVIAAMYAKHMRRGEQSHGTDEVIKNILHMLTSRILQLDHTYAPFQLRSLELGHAADAKPLPFSLSNGQKVALGGVIDRVDQKGNVIRVIDYKTGITTTKIASLDALFDRSMVTRNKTALQLLWYAWLYLKQYRDKDNITVMPAVISTRTPYTKSPHLKFSITPPAEPPITVDDITPYTDIFEAKIRTALDELFDPSIPFREAEK